MPVINNSYNNIIALFVLFFCFLKNYNKLNNQVL